MQPAVDAAVAESAGERFELSLDRRKVYGWAAAFLLLFVVLGMWWWHAAGVRRGSAVSDARMVAPVVAPVAAPPVESVDSEAERRFPTGMTKKEGMTTKEGMTRGRGVTKEGGRTKEGGSTEKSVKAVIQPAPPVPVRQPAVAAAVARTAPAAEPKSPAKSAAAVAAPKPSNSEEEAMEDSPEGGGDFHLLRRPGDPKNVPTPVGPVKPGPVVRPTSLGVMAGHVIYSPTPEYPKAASDAHVQGEVKVEAEIDRTGNVISTRVISGPPLLRQAALDAIGRWQYRPYLDHGRDPIGVNTEILVDFELP
jgi:TonB family protein